MPGQAPTGLIVPLEQMHHEVSEMAPQRVLLTDAQALYLLRQSLRGEVVPLAGPDQCRRGLRPGEEVLRVALGIGAHAFLLSPGLPFGPKVGIEHLLRRPWASLGESTEGQMCLGAGILTGTAVASVQNLGHGTPEGRALLQQCRNLIALGADSREPTMPCLASGGLILPLEQMRYQALQSPA